VLLHWPEHYNEFGIKRIESREFVCFSIRGSIVWWPRSSPGSLSRNLTMSSYRHM